LIHLLMVMVVLAAQEPSAGSIQTENGSLVEAIPYEYPQQNYEKWITTRIKVVKRRFPNISLEDLKQIYPKAKFERFCRSGDFRCSKITYSSDGLKVKGYMIEPSHSGKPLPVVIFNRGGNREFGKLSFGTLFMLHEVASWGYVVLASQYRGNDGGEGREEFGGADVNDVLNLVPLAERLEGADAKRIGLYGWSRGSMMTLLALKKSKSISAAIVGAGEADLVASIEKRPEMERLVYRELIPGYDTDKQAVLSERSAIRWVDALPKDVPILLLHGSGDKRVSPAGALALAQELYRHKHPFRLVFFEGGDHGLSSERSEVYRQVRRWLDTYVRDQASPPDLASVDD